MYSCQTPVSNIHGAYIRPAIFFCRPSLIFFVVARSVFRVKIYRPSSFSGNSPICSPKNYQNIIACHKSHQKIIARPKSHQKIIARPKSHQKIIARPKYHQQFIAGPKKPKNTPFYKGQNFITLVVHRERE